jgi:hypothetical protein
LIKKYAEPRPLDGTKYLIYCTQKGENTQLTRIFSALSFLGHCFGSESIYSGYNSESKYGKVSDPVPDPNPDPDHI